MISMVISLGFLNYAYADPPTTPTPTDTSTQTNTTNYGADVSQKLQAINSITVDLNGQHNRGDLKYPRDQAALAQQYVSTITSDLTQMAKNGVSVDTLTKTWETMKSDVDSLNAILKQYEGSHNTTVTPINVGYKPDFQSQADLQKLQTKVDNMTAQAQNTANKTVSAPAEKCQDKCKAPSGSGTTSWWPMSMLDDSFNKMLCQSDCMVVGLVLDFLNWIQTIFGQVPL